MLRLRFCGRAGCGSSGRSAAGTEIRRRLLLVGRRPEGRERVVFIHELHRGLPYRCRG